MTLWKVHDNGIVSYVWDMEDKCEVTGHWYSYERLGLYFRTRNGLQPICHLQFMWETNINLRICADGRYTAPGDSALTMDTTRNVQDVIAFTGQNEGIAYDATGKLVMSPQKGYSEKLDVLNGGYVIYFGDPRPDAELKRQAKTFQGGMKHLASRIGHSRNVECWLLGPVSLIAGQQLYGSIVAKLHGRFEIGQGVQACTLWKSDFAQDGKVDDATGSYAEGAFRGHWEGGDSDAVNAIRSNIVPLPLPSFANSVVWKLEQYRNGRTMCQAKGMSG